MKYSGLLADGTVLYVIIDKDYDTAELWFEPTEDGMYEHMLKMQDQPVRLFPESEVKANA